MKKIYSILCGLITLAVIATSCDAFLEEKPKTFLTPELYFQNEGQVVAAVNGLYTFLDDIFDGDIEPGSQTFIFIEYLSGYGERLRGSGTQDLAQANNLNVAENNGYVQKFWETGYKAIENCNSIIEGIESMKEGILTQDKKNELLGEVYFMRAYYYFNLVRLYGPVPLKLTSTSDLSNVEIGLTSIEGVYDQIDKDMTKAGELMDKSVWTNANGRVSKGAVKSLHAKIYLTMAGYPLQKGTEYYQKAYAKASEVYKSEAFKLFDTYEELRTSENAGEHIWSIQREADNAGSPVHGNMLPYPAPAKAISANAVYGGALVPTMLFYNSYPTGDKRKDEQAFYYTEHEALDKSAIVQLGRPYIYKYWDDEAANTGKSGANYTLLRYADVLLIMAEAKAQADGGTTADTDAIDAYYAVRKRALPTEAKPTSIKTNDVLKERFWEICFEGQTWYDMLRTRKALHAVTGQIVDMIGYQTPGHSAAFKEADLLLPYPIREKRLNPNLKRD
ncbi:RagB/SusD family nutrient uptake outer membrane protein [Bacteroides sp. BFG-638]|nr:MULTISPECIES: RagB/SusD family nutrient uptake outer membrane protein [unclassified Bacteroides]MCS2949006.1 RagB/SusD family nutrient uptake outer membrane protein [Bacteroides sp. BFG-638]MCS3312601.1 RagB/SusD family nutrient uptake outer membrane protein [Bacteroides sp. BFG-637]